MSDIWKQFHESHEALRASTIPQNFHLFNDTKSELQPDSPNYFHSYQNNGLRVKPSSPQVDKLRNPVLEDLWTINDFLHNNEDSTTTPWFIDLKTDDQENLTSTTKSTKNTTFENENMLLIYYPPPLNFFVYYPNKNSSHFLLNATELNKIKENILGKNAERERRFNLGNNDTLSFSDVEEFRATVKEIIQYWKEKNIKNATEMPDKRSIIRDFLQFLQGKAKKV